MTGTRVAFLALAAGLAAAPAGAAPALTPDPFDGVVWKAYDKAAGPHYQVQTTKTTNAMKVQGLDVKQDQTQTLFVRLTPGAMADGNWVVTRRVVGIKTEMDVAGNRTVYDSTDPKAAKGPLAPALEALMKVDLTFHINPRTFAVVKVEGRDELAKQLGGANPLAAGMFQGVLSDDAVKQMLDPHLAAFPSAARRAGKTWAEARKWTHDSAVDLGPMGALRVKSTYTWNKDDRVAFESTQEYAPPTPAAKGGLPFTIKAGQLDGKTVGECYAQFDRTRGRFKQVRTGMAIKGSLTMDIAGAETTVDLDQTSESTTTTHDRNPLEGK
jgi:hypothetical protein